MTYNKHEIMMHAWYLIKTYGISRSAAMKAAWSCAKAMLKAEAVRCDCEEAYCGHSKVKINDWVKHGKNRTYISVRVYTNAWHIKREIKLGYVDNMTGEYIAAA